MKSNRCRKHVQDHIDMPGEMTLAARHRRSYFWNVSRTLRNEVQRLGVDLHTQPIHSSFHVSEFWLLNDKKQNTSHAK